MKRIFSRLVEGWFHLARGMGDALLEVYRAELAQLGQDLAASGRRLGLALGLFAAAAMVAFWTLAALVAFLILVLVRLGLPPWGAAGVVLLVCLLVLVALGLVGTWHLRRAENPLDVARRRLDDHRDWFAERLLPADEAPPAEEDPDEAAAGGAGHVSGDETP